MYQPTLGSFLSRDPLGQDGVDVLYDNNWFGAALDRMQYAYCGNNPANCVDPSGQTPAYPHWAIAAESAPYRATVSVAPFLDTPSMTRPVAADESRFIECRRTAPGWGCQCPPGPYRQRGGWECGQRARTAQCRIDSLGLCTCTCFYECRRGPRPTKPTLAEIWPPEFVPGTAIPVAAQVLPTAVRTRRIRRTGVCIRPLA
jgi:RHS repeat-associated protein